MALGTLRGIGGLGLVAGCARILTDHRDASDELHQPIGNEFSGLFTQKLRSAKPRGWRTAMFTTCVGKSRADPPASHRGRAQVGGLTSP